MRFKSELKDHFVCSTITKCVRTSVVYVTVRLQLSDAGGGVVFGRQLDRPWLSPSGTKGGT